MITGDYVKCSTCGQPYKVRFNIGHVFPQKGTFKCKYCGSSLEYGWDKKRAKILVGVEIIEATDDAIVQNLHPEIPIDPSRASDPFYFPSPEYLIKYNKETDGDIASLRKSQKSAYNFKKKLDEIELDLRYLKEKRWNLLKKTYGKNTDKVERDIFKEALNTGRLFLEGKWEQLYRSVLSEVEKAKRHTHFNHLKQYLQSRKQEFLIEKMFTVLNTYNKAYHELLPTLLSLKLNMSPEGYSSGANWEKIEMVYGAFYEIYGIF